MEEKVLVQLGFDFNFSSPRHFLDRYIRILDEHLPEEYKTLALQILVLQQVSENMLNFSGSEIAASAVILAINQGRMADMVERSSDLSQNFFYGTRHDEYMSSE